MRNTWQEEIAAIRAIDEIHRDQAGRGRWLVYIFPIAIVFWGQPLLRAREMIARLRLLLAFYEAQPTGVLVAGIVRSGTLALLSGLALYWIF